MNGKKAKGREAKAPVQITPHAEVVPDPERLPFIAAIRRQMHLFPAFRPDGPERNLRFAPFTRTPPHRTAWAAPEGGCPIPVLPFLCLLCKSFQRTTPPRAHGPLEGESGCKGSTKKADGQKNGGLFWAGRGKFSQKQTKRRAGGKRGALPYGPHTGRGPERDGGRSGARRAHTARNIGKCEKGLHGARGHAGRRGGGNGKAPQKGPAGDAKGPNPESRKGRMENPQGHSRTAGKPRRARKGKEKEKGKAHARLPPHCKGKGKKGGMQTGKEKTGQRKRKGKTGGGRDRKHGQKAQGDGKGKACQIFRRDTWQAGKRKGIFYIRIIHRPHQYRIHLHRHHPYDKDYNLPAGRISRRGHTPMLDRHIPFSYI